MTPILWMFAAGCLFIVLTVLEAASDKFKKWFGPVKSLIWYVVAFWYALSGLHWMWNHPIF